MILSRAPAALLVSHGQPSSPEEGEAEIAALAGVVAPHLRDWEVRGATLAAEGALDAALGARPDAWIFPVFMSQGWFTQAALPKRLIGRGQGPLPPLGTLPALARLAARWVQAEAARAGWRIEETTVIVTAHGSGRSPFAALDTRIFAERMARDVTPAALRCGFVEQAPHLVTALRGAGDKALCLPFFAARRGHVLHDLPEAVRASGFAGRVLPPIGLHPDVPALIADTLNDALAATKGERQ